MREIFRLVGKIALDGTVELDKKLKAIDKSAKDLGRSLTKMGKDLTKIGTELTKNITLPLAALGGAVTKFGADFDKAMTESTAIMGNLSDAMKKDLENAARDVATTTRFSATEAAKAYFYLASAGLDAAQSMEALPKVAAFAQAGNFDLALATDLLTDAQSALGMTVRDDVVKNMENMVRVSDVLVKANVLANASVQQFSEALTNKAGAALRLLGKDVEEGVAVLAALADQGVKGAQAGESLNIVMRDLQRAAIENKEAFAQANIAVFDSNGEMRNMADIVSDLENRLGGMSDEQKRSELMMLGFQDRSVSAMMALLGTSDAIRRYEKELRSAGGTTDEISKKQLQNFWDQLGLLKDKLIDVALTLWENLQPVFMDVVIPALEKAADMLRALAQWFSNLDPPVKETIITLAGLAASFGPVLLIAGQAAKLFGVLIPLYGKLVTGQLSLNAAMSANPIGVVITAIYALVAAGIVLWKNWGKITEWLKNAWNSIANTAQDVFSFAKIKILEFAKTAIDSVSKYISFIPGLGDAAKAASEALDKMITAEQEKKQERYQAKIEKTKKTTEELIEPTEKLKEATDKLAKAEENSADIKGKQTQKTLDQIKAENELKDKREAFEKEWTDKLFKETASRVEILEAEKKAALDKAKELKANEADINAYYDKKITEAKEEENQKRLDNERSWRKKLLEQKLQETQDSDEQIKIRLQLLDLEYQEAIAKAKDENQDINQIETYYQNERNKIIKEANQKRAEIEKSWAEKVKEQNRQAALDNAKTLEEQKNVRLQILDEQMEAEIEEAKNTGANTSQIEAYYRNERNKIIQYYEQEATRIQQEEINKRNQMVQSSLETQLTAIMDGTSKASNIFQAFGLIVQDVYKNMAKEIAGSLAKNIMDQNQWLGKTLGNIAKAVAAYIQQAYAALVGFFAWMGPFAPLAAGGVIGTALVAIGQLANQAFKAIGLAEGGLVKSGTGGIVAQVGEGREDELVLPMQTGVDALAESLLNKLMQIAVPQPAYAVAGGGGTNNYNNSNKYEYHFHIGNYLGSEAELKNLVRKIHPIIIRENQRLGVE